MLTLAFHNHRLHALRRQGSELIWFVLADVCKILGLADPNRVASRLNEREKGTHTMSTHGGAQRMIIISEAGLYKLTYTSRKPAAQQFVDWIVHDVLPEIRRTGTYHGGSGPLDALIGELQSVLPIEPSKPIIARDDNVLHVEWRKQEREANPGYAPPGHPRDGTGPIIRGKHYIDNEASRLANEGFLQVLCGNGGSPNYDAESDGPEYDADLDSPTDSQTIYGSWPSRQGELFTQTVPKTATQSRDVLSHYTYQDHEYALQRRYNSESLFALRIAETTTTQFCRLSVLGPDNKTIVLSIGSKVPYRVLVECLPPGMPEVSLHTVKHFFGDA
jgi:BRO family, N-terminal domain